MSSFWIVPRTHRTGNIASQSFGAITDLGPRGARSTPAAPRRRAPAGTGASPTSRTAAPPQVSRRVKKRPAVGPAKKEPTPNGTELRPKMSKWATWVATQFA
jgi:hypothetical protein